MVQYNSAEEFLASKQLEIPEISDETDSASILVSRGYNDPNWELIQHARSEYLREWEEDMRYAQELANEGM